MSTYRGGRGGRGGGASSRAVRGSFTNGVWHCDCSPALPATHFPVKKEGPNKGRWFRVCQKDKAKACGFFLWDSDATPRENAALANNSRTEPGRGRTTPARARPQRALASPPPPYTPEAGPSDPKRKRSGAAAREDDDDFGLDAGDAAFTDELNQVMTDIETPSKKARTEAFATPSRRKLPWEKDDPPNASGLHTPQTEHRNKPNLFAPRVTASDSSFLTPSKHSHGNPASARILTPSSSPIATPTPNRFKDTASAGGDSELARDIFGVLHAANVNIDAQSTRELTTVLSKHTTVAEGVKKGRDVARASIKAKDAKVTELTYRLSTLEAELEAERATVQHLQWKAEHGDLSD